MIEERFDRLTADEPEQAETSPAASDDHEQANGHADEEGSPAPARKKQKREVSTEEEDAKLAAQLQAQENNLARTRATRGGGTATKKRKAPRKKSTKKVHDDSDAEGSGESAPKRKAGGGFQKPFTLSYPLAQLVGETQVRPGTGTQIGKHKLLTRPSSPAPRSSRSCGLTSRPTSFRTRKTSARYAATTRCRRSSSRRGWTCSR